MDQKCLDRTFFNRHVLQSLIHFICIFKTLEIDCMTGIGPKAWAKDYNLARSGIVAALSRCRQLRRLLCRPTALVDNDLRQVLAVNRMPHLEVSLMYY